MKTVFIYNPESGKGRLEKHKGYIQKKLSKKYGEIDWLKTTKPGHAFELAKEYGEKCDYLFVSGGDGTLNEVINGVCQNEHKPTIGYIPSGTVNDVARSLGLSKNLKKSIKILLEENTFEHDIFKVNNRYGIYVCCAGLFTKTSYETKRLKKKLFGKLAYLANGAKEIFNAKPIKVELLTDDEDIKTDCSLILVLNSRSVGGFKLNRRADLNDGAVEVIIFKSNNDPITIFDINMIFKTFLFGVKSTKNSKNVIYRTLSKFTLKLDDNTSINLDGEKSTKGTFNFECIKKGIKIIVPNKVR